MHIVIEGNRPIVLGVPEGNEILFFAKIDERGYCVIYGPPGTCLPTEGNAELWDASVAFAVGDEEMKVYPVIHGHKYSQGGGWVEFGEDTPMGREQIFFRKLDNDKRSTHEGNPIDEVYVVL
ncbi:MAG: hypothetical protein PHR36_04245 [Patescibacteria group bacterium]|nr:hypothetical protein [Patescibacteria group bacterium]